MSILTVNDKEFDEKVLKSNNLVLCDFWAEWCGPCKQISPILEELSKELSSDNITIVKVNIDDNPETPAKYGIMSIPTLLLFKNGELVSTQIGLHEKNALKKWIDSHS